MSAAASSRLAGARVPVAQARIGVRTHPAGKHVLVVGAGIVGLSIAYYCARKGHRVTLIERGGPARDGCSFVNAGMVVPSHIVPLASPGMMQRGLRWMWNRESPFYVKPRLDADLLGWGIRSLSPAAAC